MSESALGGRRQVGWGLGREGRLRERPRLGQGEALRLTSDNGRMGRGDKGSPLWPASACLTLTVQGATLVSVEKHHVAGNQEPCIRGPEHSSERAGGLILPPSRGLEEGFGGGWDGRAGASLTPSLPLTLDSTSADYATSS